MLFFKNLLTSNELDVLLLNTPIGYMKNSYILEHVRILETPNLFSFFAALQSIDNQEHICNTLLKGTLLAGLMC